MSLMIELSDRMAVMYAGRFVEMADAKTMFADPRHPYTRALINAFPPLPDPSPPWSAWAKGCASPTSPTCARNSPATGSHPCQWRNRHRRRTIMSISAPATGTRADTEAVPTP